MGKLIKNHWARLIVLSAAFYQFAAAFEGFFWPKFFFDFATTNFNGAVKPIPILQTINLVLAIGTFAYEWPVGFIAGSPMHASIPVRMAWLPLVSLTCVLQFQATNAALYYLIALIVYFWAYTEGEVICAVPWTLPKRNDRRRRVEKV